MEILILNGYLHTSFCKPKWKSRRKMDLDQYLFQKNGRTERNLYFYSFKDPSCGKLYSFVALDIQKEVKMKIQFVLRLLQ